MPQTPKKLNDHEQFMADEADDHTRMDAPTQRTKNSSGDRRQVLTAFLNSGDKKTK